ncbi:phospho-N-acetylmuramoyl-pentapeptide-transferase [bacterium]|nr:phospho-N-acetylmuramoyl-pentapeptide-transferase [bacterium]
MSLIVVAALVAIILSLLSGVVYIDFLKKKMFGQSIRDCAPESHAKKSGTPTTGGVFIVGSSLIGAIISLIMAQKLTTSACLLLMTFVFFMFAGLMDDILKIKNHHNEGLTPRAKLFLQVAIALLPALYMTFTGATYIDFGQIHFDLGYFYPLFAIFTIVGVSNAVNLTDGLDGLAASNITISLIACIIISVLTGNNDIAIISAAIAGASAGFLYFNKYPAKVFMGDTGSLALGGVLGAIAIMGKFELWLIPIGFIYMSETLSVMLQVASFKLTGKRIFRMTPIHHHFELGGWKETKVVAVFTAVTILFSILAVVLFWYLSR